MKEISIYTDGDNEPVGLKPIIHSWEGEWNSRYAKDGGPVKFIPGINLKATSYTSLPPLLRQISQVRNPDLYFSLNDKNIELGGIEITLHSPDGSNVEKRYPYLWASQRVRIDAFVACSYQKRRPSGQVNRLPHRHSNRNLNFIRNWEPTGPTSSCILQIIPIRELQGSSISLVPAQVQPLLLKWQDIGEFFAHSLASKTLMGSIRTQAMERLEYFRQKLKTLALACAQNTTDTDASSLLKQSNKRWIQVYNTRPESGHWERGEGQFDSIDGRLMFTLDEISSLPDAQRPQNFEFWLPQISSQHPWIKEQVARNFGSKRLRNILVVLKEICITKFSDDLTPDDWKLLEENRGLLLERLDWSPGLFKVTQVVPKREREVTSRQGLKNMPRSLQKALLSMLNDEALFFSAHRAYLPNWKAKLASELETVPIGSVVLMPRLPAHLIKNLDLKRNITIRPAEECTKAELIMLRQIHKKFENNISVFGTSS